jgi:gamma-glutamyltranspeptidase/glutathione hydrolase
MSARVAGIAAPLTRRAVFALLALCVVTAMVTASATAADRAPGKAAIASAHPLASEAGYEVLRAGGNAFDAAVAVSAALMVVEPSGSGFLGGGMYLLHRASDGRNIVIDARKKPRLRRVATCSWTRTATRCAACPPTALAAGTREPAGPALLQSRYGRLTLAQALSLAIRLARTASISTAPAGG